MCDLANFAVFQMQEWGFICLLFSYSPTSRRWWTGDIILVFDDCVSKHADLKIVENWLATTVELSVDLIKHLFTIYYRIISGCGRHGIPRNS